MRVVTQNMASPAGATSYRSLLPVPESGGHGTVHDHLLLWIRPGLSGTPTDLHDLGHTHMATLPKGSHPEPVLLRRDPGKKIHPPSHVMS